MSQNKTLTELIDTYTWYDKKNKAQEIFRKLQAGLGGQITTQEDGININENTTTLNFTGDAVNVTDLGEGSVEINILNSGTLEDQDNNNKIIAFSLPLIVPIAVKNYINQLPTFTVEDTESPYFLATPTGISNTSGRGTSVFILNELGKGTYGVGGTELTTDDIVVISNIPLLPSTIENDPATQFIELGNIGSSDIVTGFNNNTFTGSEDPIQDQEDGYVLINVIIDGDTLQYLFVGLGGNYGVGGTETAFSEDFTLLTGTETFQQQDLQSVTDIGATTTNPITVVNDLQGAFAAAAVLPNKAGGLLGVSSGSNRAGYVSFIHENNHRVNITSPNNPTQTGGSLSLRTPDLKDVTKIIPVNFTDGTTTISSNVSGMVDLSSLSLGGGGTALEIYSESGTLAGGDGIATIGDINWNAEINSGIAYVQDNIGSSLVSLRGDDILIKSDSAGGIAIKSGNGIINLQTSNSLGVRTQSFQNKSGTIALLDDVVNPTGLEAIDEGNGIGWRLIGKNPAQFGNIGLHAIDFGSYNADVTQGAIGVFSFNVGEDNVNSGYGGVTFGYDNSIGSTGNDVYGFVSGSGNTMSNAFTSTIFGFGNTTSSSYTFTAGVYNSTSQLYSNTIGIGLISKSVGSTAVGQANTDYTSTSLNNVTGRNFIVGNGTLSAGSPNTVNTRSDAFIVYQGGEVVAPSLTEAKIDTEATGKVLVTKEWVNAQGFGSGTPLEIYSESGTLVGGDGEAIIGDINPQTGNGSGLYYTQNFDNTGSSILGKADTVSLYSEGTDSANELSLLSVKNRVVFNNSPFFSASSVFLDFDNVINNALNNITLEVPLKSGTIALLDDVSTSEWVTYTGTRAGGDLIITLGDYDNTDTTFKVDVNTEDAWLQVYDSGEYFTKMLTNGFQWYNGVAEAILSNTNLTSDRTFELPDASGTIALISDVGIPLEGTEVGSPVTGDIEIGDYDVWGIKYTNPYDSSIAGLYGDDGNFNLRFNDGTYQMDFGNSTDLSQYYALSGDNPLFKGIEGSEYYGDLATDNTYIQKKYVTKTITPNTALSVDMSNSFGNDCNMLSANTADNLDTFVLTKSAGAENGYATILVNSASEPNVGNSAVKEVGATFLPNEDMYLIIKDTPRGYRYFWSYDTVNPTVSTDAETLDGLTASQFLRSDIATTKSAGDLTFSDNVKTKFGTRSELSTNGTGETMLNLITDDYFVIRDNSTTRFSVERTTGQVNTNHITTQGLYSQGIGDSNTLISKLGNHDGDGTTGRGTQVVVNDGARTVSAGDVDLVSNGLRFVIDNTTGQFTMGDDTGVNGGTHISIDEPNGEVIINAANVNFTGIPTYADDAAAGTGGLTAGQIYSTATGELRIKL